jgi:hypothetical protein
LQIHARMKPTAPTAALKTVLLENSSNYTKIRRWLAGNPPRESVLSMMVIEHQRKGGPRGPVMQALMAFEIKARKEEIFHTINKICA